MIPLFAALLLSAPQDCRPINQQVALQLRLHCEKVKTSPSQPLECAVTLQSNRSNGLIVAPRVFLPFDMPRWPRSRLKFEIEAQGTLRTLAPSDDAKQGRYDVGIFTERSAMLLRGGDVYGFLYDLNGADWTLPTETTRARIRAHLEIDLLQRDGKGRLYPGVSHYLKGRDACAANLVLHGSWASAWVSIELTRGAADERGSPSVGVGADGRGSRRSDVWWQSDSGRRALNRSLLFHFGSQLDRFAVIGTEDVRRYLLERATTTDPMVPDARSA